ncbi:clasp N terminal-domain-containing protein [Cokeromyces recurvatus]|uniref:clasp N terminal-domain-containing protein n=1 Tax=Cokeromyces recurvatus TaxID=90255 RepID=UPI00222091D1|nr:clasp N terminal-domain-containing protein [Cokeromyces recurvatus]KAI7902943.1 clasp N terminal-domain-containing protein [Cokeromyces recurvatus]
MTNNIKINSLKELEAFFSDTNKLFEEKENEENWNKRDKAVRDLRSLLNNEDYLRKWRANITKCLHDGIYSYIKSIDTLRSSVVIEGLSLISDIGKAIGYGLDLYTMEIIVINLLKLSNNSKKLIASKVLEAANMFFLFTNFYSRIFVMLCKTINDKSTQVRQFSANCLKTMLSTHGSKETVQSIIEKPEVNLHINNFLMKGLVDASPAVRDVSKQIYTIYGTYWPIQAQKLTKTFDVTMQRQLKIPNTATATSKTSRRYSPYTLGARSKSLSSLSSPSSKIANNTSKALSSSQPSSSTSNHPILKRSPSDHSPFGPESSSEYSAQSTETITKLINVDDEKSVKGRLSSTSNVSTPPTDISHKVKTIQAASTIPPRRAQSEPRNKFAISASRILTMLKSRDPANNCKGLQVLSEKLQDIIYKPSSLSTLPTCVPSKDIIEHLLKRMIKLPRQTISNNKEKLYKALMSWESLAGVFVLCVPLKSFIPYLIIADQELKANGDSQKNKSILKLYSKGLERMKLFLKRHHPSLPEELLNILKSVNNMKGKNTVNQLDIATINKQQQQQQQQFTLSELDYLQCGILEWMNDVVLDNNHEDQELLLEGSKWLNISLNNEPITDWFKKEANVRLYMHLLVDTIMNIPHTSEKETSYLSNMTNYLKAINEHIFQEVTITLNKFQMNLLSAFLSLKQTSSFEPKEENEFMSDMNEQIESNDTKTNTNDNNAFYEDDYSIQDTTTTITSNNNESNTDNLIMQQSPELSIVNNDISIVDRSTNEQQKDTCASHNATREASLNASQEASLVASQEASLVASQEASLVASQEASLVASQSQTIVKEEKEPNNKVAQKETITVAKCEQTNRNVDDFTSSNPIINPGPDLNNNTIVNSVPQASNKRSSSTALDKQELEQEESRRRKQQKVMKHNDNYEDLLQVFINTSKINPENIDIQMLYKIEWSLLSVWKKKTEQNLLFPLLQQLIDYIQSKPVKDCHLRALKIIQKLLTSQSLLFKQLENQIFKKEGQNNECIIIQELCSMILDILEDNDCVISYTAKNILNSLFSNFSPDISLQLAQQYSASCISLDKSIPLGVLLTEISIIATKVAAANLSSFLDKGLAEILVDVIEILLDH